MVAHKSTFFSLLFIGLWSGAGLVLTAVPCSCASPAAKAEVNRLTTADDYYLGRENIENVQRGLQILHQLVNEDVNNFEAWWRISRSNNYLGREREEHADEKAAMHFYQAGIDAGRKAVAIAGNRVEGHFWLGANYGLLAEDEGWIRGLRLLDTVRTEMEAVIRLDADYEQCSGPRTLARLYYRAPFFKGGDKQRSIDLLQSCVKRYPQDSFALLYLADDYAAVGRRDEARQLLENILNLCPDPLYGPELANNQKEARDRLEHGFSEGK